MAIDPPVNNYIQFAAHWRSQCPNAHRAAALPPHQPLSRPSLICWQLRQDAEIPMPQESANRDSPVPPSPALIGRQPNRCDIWILGPCSVAIVTLPPFTSAASCESTCSRFQVQNSWNRFFHHSWRWRKAEDGGGKPIHPGAPQPPRPPKHQDAIHFTAAASAIQQDPKSAVILIN